MILNNFQRLLFCSHTFCVRRRYQRYQAGSGKIRTGSSALGLTVWHQKKALKIIRNIYLIVLIKMYLRLRYRASDPNFGQNPALKPIHLSKNRIKTENIRFFGNICLMVVLARSRLARSCSISAWTRVRPDLMALSDVFFFSYNIML